MNETYDEYIRSILGNETNNDLYDNFIDNENVNFEKIEKFENRELENYYPEIYKVVYPMIKTKCDNYRAKVTKEELESMTDEIYFAVVPKDKNINNEMVNNRYQRQVRNPYKRAEVDYRGLNDKRICNGANCGLRELIKVLLIRELLGRPGYRPPMPPPPPRPPFSNSRPPFN